MKFTAQLDVPAGPGLTGPRPPWPIPRAMRGSGRRDFA